MAEKDRDVLERLLSMRFAAHPWHGVPIGDRSPEEVAVYVEIVPTDTVKYELDKATGHLKIDRPQRYSSFAPTLYGFILFYEITRRPAAPSLARLAQLVADNRLRPHVDAEVAWTEIADHAQRLMDRQTVGKIVLLVR